MINFTTFIYRYGLIATFLIILIEYACFPVSSEIVLPFSGAIANMNNTNFILLLIISVIAGLFGSLACYMAGRLLGNRVITYIISRFPKAQKGFDSSTCFFDRYGNKAVCIARLIPLCRTYISFVAGALKLNIVCFLIYSAIGISIWNFFLIGLGYTLGSNWQHAVDLYQNYKYTIILSIAISFTIFIIIKLTRKVKS